VRVALVSGTVALLAGMSLSAADAQAGYQQWGAHNLPGHVWDGSGLYVNGLYYERVEAETSSSVCVGPVVKSGGGYVAPYGWKCSARIASWEWPALTGEAAVYNPNSGTIPSFSAIDNFTG
jgi:hypothetical protein